MTIRSYRLAKTVAPAVTLLFSAQPVMAALQYQAKNATQCAAITLRASRDVFEAKKAKIDQNWYSKAERRVRTDNPNYLEQLERARRDMIADQSKYESWCRGHFASNTELWLIGWAYEGGYRVGSGRWR